MKRILTSELLAEIEHFRNVLEQNDIRCIVKNEQLSGALGEVPFLECLPELWVVNDADQGTAERLLKELRNDRSATASAEWRCPKCHETNEGQFAVCWNCGAPGSED